MQLAIEAMQNQMKALDTHIAELRAELKGGSAKEQEITAAPTVRKRKARTAAQRAAQAERMRAFWAGKRNAKARGVKKAVVAKPKKGTQSDATRQMISERMKAYWAKKRKAQEAPAAKKLTPAKPTRRPMSAAAKKVISDKMRLAWARRKAEAAKKAKQAQRSM